MADPTNQRTTVRPPVTFQPALGSRAKGPFRAIVPDDDPEWRDADEITATEQEDKQSLSSFTVVPLRRRGA